MEEDRGHSEAKETSGGRARLRILEDAVHPEELNQEEGVEEEEGEEVVEQRLHHEQKFTIRYLIFFLI